MRTALYATHISLSARIVPFAGWEMPVQYTGILAETKTVREAAGLFDVSHMGRVEIRGADAATFLNRVLSVDVPGLRLGRGRYNVICNQQGGIIDDCIVYRRHEDRFLLIPNAANLDSVIDWLRGWLPADSDLNIEDVTSETVMIAHQGPKAIEMLQGLTSIDLSALRPFATADGRVAGVDTLVARTGYTGEDGVELIMHRDGGPPIWNALMEKGAEPCGLGARDVLRLEAGLLLHGNDMDTSTNPYEAGLDRFVKPDREEYVAGDALRRSRDGVSRRLVGFTMLQRGIPRPGYVISDGSGPIGRVTSGGPSPTLDTNIGLGYVPIDYSAPDSRFQIEIRGRPVEAVVTPLPFYSRKRSA